MLRQKILNILFFLMPLTTAAQDISFFHLSKKDGLSDNRVSGVVMDQNGLLWVSTSEGLNCYDGYKVTRFYKEEYPALQNNNILRMTCDEKNRLWIHFVDKSITMLDEERKFNTISIVENGQPVKADFLLPYTSRGVLFLSGSKLYSPDKKNPLKINRLHWQEDTALSYNFRRINTWDKDKLICSGYDRLCLFDVTNLKVLHTLTIPDVLAAVRLSDNEALITTTNNSKLCKVNFTEKKIVSCYGNLKDQFGEEMMIYPRSIYHLRDKQFVFTSAYAGLYLFDAAANKLVRYKHDPVDPKSISADNTSFLFSDTSGYFFISSNSTGLNYFNINHYLARWQPSFRDSETGKIFDGYINCITQSSDGNIWLGTQNSLIEWDRKNNTTFFHSYGKKGQELKDAEEVRAICFDKQGKIWIGLNRFGVVVMDHKKNIIKYLDKNETNNSLSGNLINEIREAPDGNIWIASSRGLNIVNPDNFEIIKTNQYSYLQTLNERACNFIYFTNEREGWIATNDGAFRIDLISKSVKPFNIKNSLKDNAVSCITGDNKGNIYIGTSSGLTILNGDKVIAFYDRSNGLRSNKCEGLLTDNNGNIWIGNNTSLVCYNPAGKSLVAYDNGAGLSDAGFRPNAFYKKPDGEILWGGDEGVNYFFPEKLRSLNLPLRPIVYSVTTSDSSYWLAGSKRLSLPWSKNSISFAFSAIDLYSSGNIYYKYMLEGADDSWKIIPGPQELQYSKLPSGNYTFKLLASRDGDNWVPSKNDIVITIRTPWWQSKLFIACCVALVISLSTFVWGRRSKKLGEQKEQIEIEKAINHFASSMNEQTTTDDILWDVARNCISRLKFEDCVIYLLEKYRRVLIQKAAWGPKNIDVADTTDDNDKTKSKEHSDAILNPIEIPVGKGIVGSVAKSAIAEIINDTSKDERYIVDDQRRNSEIAVPITYNGNVLGIIDSENSKKNFFTQKHLSILTTIASLCANKLVKLQAENDKQHALMELLKHQRKTAEAQLKSLRLQMNPHFLFNSLNSIQQLILAGDEKAATLYLSKFSRLLRSVLSHSDKEKVSLKEELEMLRLYVELESLRFKESFHYEIVCDETIDADEIKIPTLLIQPFVENAIWHGLLHKEGPRSLCISLSEDSTENIICVVQDNGIGREAAKKINVADTHAGKGIAVAEERLKTYNKHHVLKSKVLIEDLKDINGNAAGTKVMMTLPLINKKNAEGIIDR